MFIAFYLRRIMFIPDFFFKIQVINRCLYTNMNVDKIYVSKMPVK